MRVALLGLGLIGGSLGLALRRAGGFEVVGWDRDAASVAAALRLAAIDAGAIDASQAVALADLVVVATPVGAFREVFGAIAGALKPGALVTDVASTKAQVGEWAREAGLPFVGGHPMAGSEQVGVAHARADMFVGARWCLTPTSETPREAIARVEALARAAGAEPMIMEAREHDARVAAISHLPFAASAALVALTTGDPHWERTAPLAASGYRDATRLASGSPAMYRDICLTNGEAIAPLLRALAATLESLAERLDDAQALEAFFTRAHDAREAWTKLSPAAAQASPGPLEP